MRIRAYLMWMAVAILLPVIVFSAVALRMLQNAERTAALRGLHETAERIALLVDRDLYTAEAALQVLAASPSLAAGDLPAFYEQAKSANRGPNGWTLLLDRHGQQLINTVIPFGGALPPPVAKERVAQVMASQATLVSGVLPGPIVKRLVTTVNVPAVLADGRHYVLVEAFSTDHFKQLIAGARIPQAWVAAIIDGNGRFIARSLQAESMVGKSARPELVAATRAAGKGQIRHQTWEGMEAYDVFTHSTLSGWTIAVAAPVELIDRSAFEAAMVAGLGMLAAMLCAAGIAVLSGDWHVMAIRRAARAAIELGQGKMPQLARSRVVEVNELHVALHAAGEQLLQAQQYRLDAEAERHALLLREQGARQAAEEQNTAKDQFLAMLGHELRNPLAPISTAAQLLRLPGLDEARARYASEVISRQIEHMNSLVGDLLDVSRVTRGLVTLELETVAVEAVLAGAVEQVRTLMTAKHQHLRMEQPEQAFWPRGDKTRLIQIMANLLNNAAKYTQEGGHIVLALQAQADWLELSVRDNGSGITAALLPRVFDLFSQGERMPDRAQGGLGLGLALVKSLVELHGGSVLAQSDGTGQGSRFTVRLPRLAQAMADPPGMAALEPAPGSPLKVMLVDDNVDAARSLELFLREAGGHRVCAYYDAKSALERAPLEAPQVFILDIGLPDMDGYELARRLRSSPYSRDALLIALTGYGQSLDRERALAAGFDHHLAKPAEPAQILALLAQGRPPQLAAVACV